MIILLVGDYYVAYLFPPDRAQIFRSLNILFRNKFSVKSFLGLLGGKHFKNMDLMQIDW